MPTLLLGAVLLPATRQVRRSLCLDRGVGSAIAEEDFDTMLDVDEGVLAFRDVKNDALICIFYVPSFISERSTRVVRGVEDGADNMRTQTSCLKLRSRPSSTYRAQYVETSTDIKF